MDEIVTDCGATDCRYAADLGGVRTNGGCVCDKCPECGKNVSRAWHRDWCERKGWSRGMSRKVVSGSEVWASIMLMAEETGDLEIDRVGAGEAA